MEEVYVLWTKLWNDEWCYSIDAFSYTELMKEFEEYCYDKAALRDDDDQEWKAVEIQYKIDLGNGDLCNELIEEGCVDLEDFRPDFPDERINPRDSFYG